MSELDLRSRSLDNTADGNRAQNLDFCLDTSLEWFSPIAEKRRWLWRKSNSTQSHRVKRSDAIEVGSSDLQAGLAEAIVILKDEVARNHSKQEATKKELDTISNELLECKTDLTFALSMVKGIFLLVRYKVRCLALSRPLSTEIEDGPMPSTGGNPQENSPEREDSAEEVKSDGFSPSDSV